MFCHVISCIVSQSLLMFVIFYTHYHEQNSSRADLCGTVMVHDFATESPIP